MPRGEPPMLTLLLWTFLFFLLLYWLEEPKG
jgi:hypothetical protein